MRAQVAVFAVCAALCVVAHVAILRSIIRRRVHVGEPGVPQPRFVVELVWAIVPIIALALLLTATWERVRDTTGVPPAVMKVAS